VCKCAIFKKKKGWIIVYKCVTGVYVYRVDEGLIYSIFNF